MVVVDTERRKRGREAERERNAVKWKFRENMMCLIDVVETGLSFDKWSKEPSGYDSDRFAKPPSSTPW
jgi:hypothetical protein